VTIAVDTLNDRGIEEGQLRKANYSEAHESIQRIKGVGPKVADCVLLFGLGHMEAFPLDRWSSDAIEKYYPELYEEDLQETSANVREYFGEYAGYAQQYLFHKMRDEEGETTESQID
jgi:N-glycosylase/DNA lyase